ncbi:hypothetical protein ACEPAF_2357 [Sanghuangporus sanghuang]
MSFFSSSSSSFSSISQPKMRQEGFHLPSPSPSSGHPPSPPPGPFDLFLTHSSHHAHQGANDNCSNNNNGGGSGGINGGSGSGLPSLSLPDAFSRTNAMDLTDELAMSLMNPASPATSNERSTHTPPVHQGQNHGSEQTHMHNIFDISAPPSSHFTGAGAHAFSLPHTSHRPDLPPLSQPASLATSHLHGHYDHHSGNYAAHAAQNGLFGGRDTFPAHFNSTIPPLSTHHDPHPPSLALSASGTNDLTDPFGPFTPTSTSSLPARDSESPQPLGGSRKRADSRSATGGPRSSSRSRSRARPTTGSSQNQSQGGGPTRTAKGASRRRDSFTLPPHLSHSHSHSQSHSMSNVNQTQLGHHLHNLPSPPLGGNGSASRPSSIVIPPHGGPGGALSPLGNMGGLGSALSPLGPGPGAGHLNGSGPGIGQASGWFGVNEFKGVNGVNINGINGNGHSMNAGANAGSAPGAEFSLPTPDSVSHGPFGAFGTSVGSMGISPKDTVTSGSGKEEPATPLDPAAKQAAIVNEKRRRRRESHNAVERRRRDNINEKISELATLIPQVMLDPTGAVSSGANDDKKDKDFDDGDADIPEKPSASSKSKTAKGDKAEKESSSQPVKANKGMILRKSVEYIRYLQQLVGVQAARNRELESRLAEAGIVPPASSNSLPILLPGSGTDPQADELAGMFGAEGLHVFDDRAMELGGVNGIGNDMGGGFASHFGGLEPMAEMDMEMDMDIESTHGVHGKHPGNAAAGSSDAGDDREADDQDRDVENDRDQDRGSSVSGSGASDASSPQERRDASSDRSEEQSLGSISNDREERGRRGRDGKVHLSGSGVTKSPSVSSLTGRISRRRSKLVAVKEESSGMEV